MRPAFLYNNTSAIIRLCTYLQKKLSLSSASAKSQQPKSSIYLYLDLTAVRAYFETYERNLFLLKCCTAVEGRAVLMLSWRGKVECCTRFLTAVCLCTSFSSEIRMYEVFASVCLLHNLPRAQTQLAAHGSYAELDVLATRYIPPIDAPHFFPSLR